MSKPPRSRKASKQSTAGLQGQAKRAPMARRSEHLGSIDVIATYRFYPLKTSGLSRSEIDFASMQNHIRLLGEIKISSERSMFIFSSNYLFHTVTSAHFPYSADGYIVHVAEKPDVAR